MKTCPFLNKECIAEKCMLFTTGGNCSIKQLLLTTEDLWKNGISIIKTDD